MEELPCPQRIPFDSGVGFSIGTTLGTLWNTIKGYRENPSARWEGVKRSVRTNAPRLGGNFAAWGTLFSMSECTLVGIRHQDDAWNRIAAGAFTSGALALRGGRGAILRGAIVGGSLLALIEGVSFMMGRMMGGGMPSPEEEMMRQQQEQESMQGGRQLGRTPQPRAAPSPAPKPRESVMMSDGDDVDEGTFSNVMMSDGPDDSQQASSSESKGLFSRMLGR